MQYSIDTGTFQVVMESADINAVVGENARIDVGQAINYIKTGTSEIEEAVHKGLVLIGEQVDKAEAYAESASQSAEMAYRYRSTYIHEQAVASSEWVINHNLNKFTSVTVVDSSGNVFHPAVQYVDENTCIIMMNGATTGKAYLN